jgi:hypothetical protein
MRGFIFMKPKHCLFCNLGAEGIDKKTLGMGFVEDGTAADVSNWAKLRCVVVSEMPSRDEVNLGTPLAGDSGYARWKRFFETAGWQREEVGFTWVTRCYKWNPVARKPGLTGASASDAMKKCRHYDKIVPAFKPTTAVISQSPSDCIITPAFYRLIVADLTKARLLADKGLRPLILLGEVAKDQYFPNLKGAKKWYGGSWFVL